MKLYNTLSRSIEELQPLKPPVVTMYCCGPTVYDYTHIGHMRKYVMDDILKRTLQYLGFEVKHVLNVTDVGHLSDDTDSGEDKLEKGARKQNKTVWYVAKEFTNFFHETMQKVNVLPPDIECKATDHIPGMIGLIKELEEKGFTYETKEALYFDVTKFPDYGKLSGQKLDEKKQAVREEVNIDPDKKNPADFALWFKRVGRFAEHTMHWEAPWGDGFPGWHIECSAMSMQYLGPQIDIHTGGIDHIPVHHENEIAQSEAATGKQFVKYWVHHNFLMVEGKKMSKSLGNFYTYEDIEKKGIDPFALRLLFMQAHYRQEMNFTWEAAEAANEAYKKLIQTMIKLRTNNKELSNDEKKQYEELKQKFSAIISEDLDTPKAVAFMWEAIKSSEYSDSVKFHFVRTVDAVFGFEIVERTASAYVKEEYVLPEEITKLKERRDAARLQKNFVESDKLRDEIEKQGFIVEDFSTGTVITKK